MTRRRFVFCFEYAFSLLEIVGGILAYFVSQKYLLRLVTMVTQEELTEDPQDIGEGKDPADTLRRADERAQASEAVCCG